MAFVIFGLSAIMLVILATLLSTFADIIDRDSTIKAIFISLLLGGASALPEFTTSFTSVFLDNPDLAAGNVFGSNAFNISILALMDIIFRKHKTFNHTSKDHAYNIIFIMVLSLYAALTIFIKIPYSIWGIGLDTIIMVVIYIAGIRLISNSSQSDMTGPDVEYIKESPVEEQVATTKEETFMTRFNHFTDRLSVKQAYLGFFICAVLVMVFGALLTFSADEIAVVTGLGSTFVGSTLLALGTSLPETTSVINSIRLKNYNLAVGAILGSTTFNFMNIAITDGIYRNGLLFSSVSNSHILTLLTCVVLYGITLYAVRRKPNENTLKYLVPSILIVLFYSVLSYLLFNV